MNEHFLLSKSPHESIYRADTDSGGEPVSQTSPPLVRSSLSELLLPFVGCIARAMQPGGRSVGAVVALLLLWLAAPLAMAQTPTTVDLSLTKSVSKQNPTIGEVITYTVVVENSPTSTTATNVVVTDQLLADGATYVPNSASVSSGTFTPGASGTLVTSTWNIPSIAPGVSTTLTFQATVKARGVWFNTAEVTAVDQADADSPEIGNVYEDDYAAVCFAIPILWYAGDEYTVSVPAGYDQIVWYRDNQPISASATSASIAVVNQDNSLTIKATGVYRFVTFKNGCESSNCCNIELIPGPLAGLGDYVWADINGNGQQDTGEPPIPGVVVTLYLNGSATSTTAITDANGLYSFTGLTPGSSNSYAVGFTTPSGFTATLANQGNDATDSDPVNGITQSVTLAASEYNPTLDAGFLPFYDVGIAKAVLNRKGSYLPGDQITYELTVTNNSAFPVYNVQVNDQMPVGVSFVSSGNGLVSSGPNSTSTTIAGPLNAGASVSLTYVAQISQSYSATSVTNVAVVGPFTSTSNVDGFRPTDSNPNNNTATATVPVGNFASLGDFVWADLNANGQQDAGEPGIPGVVVTLYVNGQPTSTTTLTDATGFYSFTGLTPGNSFSYSVGFGTPSGMTATQANQGNDATDSDAVNGLTQSITLASGENNPTLDAGFLPPFDVGIAKTVVNQRSSYLPGDQITYQLAVTNNSAYPVYNVVVNDLLPPNTTFVEGTGFTASGANSVSAVIAGPLTASGTLGSSTSLTLTLQLSNPYPFTSVTNVAVVTPFTSVSNTDGYKPRDTNPANNTATVTVPVISPDLVVTVVPPVCNTATNNYTTTGTVSLTNTQAGTLVITDNGTVVYSQTIAAGTTSVPFTLTGVSNGPASRTVIASVVNGLTVTSNTTYSVPESCTKVSCPQDFSLTVSSNSTICNGESVTLVASSPVPGAKICWYLTPTDGQALVTLDSGQPFAVTITSSDTFYAEAVTIIDGVTCVSGRKPVHVMVTTIPTPICLGNIRNVCPSRTVDLTKIQITNSETIYSYEWYTSIDRAQGTQVTNLTAVGAGTYYLFAKLGRCYSNPSVTTVEIVDCNCQNVAGVNVGPGVSVCEGQPVSLTAVLTGSATSVVWSTSGTGTFSNPNSPITTYTPSAQDITNGSVLLTATTNDPDGSGICQAATSSLIATINARPKAPINLTCADSLVCQGQSTKVFALVVNGNNQVMPGVKINWYDQTNKLVGTVDNGAPLVITPSVSGQVVYTAEAVSADNCISPRSSLTITVGTCLADLAVVKKVVSAGPYKLGQKITYSITASNNGPITGTDVTVSDVMPSNLSFVSATPASEYNAATGVWTIGTLTKGSDRSLLIEATINSAGSILNTAIIGGSNNDPKRSQNDTSSVRIDVGECVVKAPHIECAVTDICVDGSTKLTASGCEGGVVHWSDGQTGVSVDVSPKVTTTYTASCVLGRSCVSPASNAITIRVITPTIPTITATADKVCPGASVTLTAGYCEGTVEWSEGAQTGSFIVVQPYTKTTYTAQCRVGNCPGKPATKTIDIATDLPTPTIVCSTSVVCPGESVTLTVENCVGTPVWSSTTQTTGSIVVFPTVGNNTYTVYCTNGVCRSKPSKEYVIEVTEPKVPTVTASADSICAGQPVTLTATGCNGTVQWNVTGRNGQIMTGSIITVNPRESISYYAQCKYRSCISDPSNAVPITVVSPQAPDIAIRPAKTVFCSGESLTLTAEGCNGGTICWHAGNTMIGTGASMSQIATVATEYYAVCKMGSCESDPSLKIKISVNTTPGPAPTVMASATSVCEGGVVSLSAMNCNGNVKWSDGQMGNVVSVTATASNNEFYAVCTPTSGTACGSSRSKVIRVNVTPAPTPTVTCSTGEICPGESVTLTVNNCAGTPYWSTGETAKTTIVVSPTATTPYTVYCQDGVCRSATSKEYTIKVTPVPAPTIVASATVVEPGGTISLSAIGCVGEVIWNANDVNGNNKGEVIVVRPEGTQTYYAQCRYRTCLSDPSITIVVNPGNCIADAGSLTAVNTNVCAGTATSVTLDATPNGGLVKPEGYSVLYVLTKGDGLVIQQTSATPSFTVAATAGNYTIHTLVYNANAGDKNYLDLSGVVPGVTTGADVLKLIADRKVCADLDAAGAKVNVKIVAPPTLASLPSLTVCAGSSVTLTAAGCDGGTVTWSDKSTGASIVRTVNSNLFLTAVCTIDGCTSQPSAGLNVAIATYEIPTIAVDKPVICTGETVSLTATGCNGGTYVWSDPASTTGSVLTVTPQETSQYRVKCMIGQCVSDWSASNTITVGTPQAPTVAIAGSAQASTTLCFGSPVTLVAEGCPQGSYVTWSNQQVGTSITITPSQSGTYTAQCCTSNNCKSVPSRVIAVTVLPKVQQPTVADRTNTCPFNTVDLTTAVVGRVSTVGGMFEFYTSETLNSESKVANPAAVGTGTYYVIEKTVDGCTSLPVVIHVRITNCTEQTPCDEKNPATADAGTDASICAAKTYQLAGKMGGSGKTAQWTTSGTGKFDDPFALNAIYTASLNDILAGKVTLTLSVSTNNTACPVAKDQMELTINGGKTVPTISPNGSISLCFGDSVKLTASEGAGYLWNNRATTKSIVVKTSGVYSVQVVDANGCTSVKSEKVTINVAEPVLPPLVGNLRNVCPSKIVDLTKALSSTTAGSTYTYRICECVTSNVIMRPDSVCEGTYWVVEKTAQGCLSKPAKIVVKTFDCAADTLDTDVSITKLASTSNVSNGQPVTYTISVTNQGTHTAKNIDVRDVLPAGLELVPSTISGFTVSNGVIHKRIDSLKAGASASITFDARILKKGQSIVNKAEITYLDNEDPNLTNNTSSVAVQDTSTRKASLIGLAKAVLGTPEMQGDSVVNVNYQFVIRNFGDDTLRNVGVTDDLAAAFAPHQVISVAPGTDANSTLQLNTGYSGAGANANLLDSTSYILPGAVQRISLAVSIKRVPGDSSKVFSNTAVATAMNSLTMVSDASANGGDPDEDSDNDPGNNTGVTSFTLGSQPKGPAIGLALAVVKIEPQGDGSYNVTYKATVKNAGTVNLTDVSISDTLARTFPSPASFSIVSGPTVAGGSSLVANTAYNGNTDANLLTSASSLSAGAVDSVLVVVNVQPNGNNGPFYASATAKGRSVLDSNQIVMDISNNGINPNPLGSISTPVRFDLPIGLLGIAKDVAQTRRDDGTYDVLYTILLKNMGTGPLNRIQVVDNLSETFAGAAILNNASNPITVTAGPGLTPNPNYTGEGLLTNMLVDSASSLAVGGSSSLTFKVHVGLTTTASSLTFNNTAFASALSSTSGVVSATSTAGTNPDPDNDLDPRNNNSPTPVVLNNAATNSHIGVAMSVRDTVRQADGTFNVTYQVVVRNFGPSILTHVSVSDTLSKVFNASTGATYKVVRAPYTTSTGSALKLNDKFDGGAEPLLVIGDSTSRLSVSQVDTILVVLNVATNGSTTTFLNTVYARARNNTGTVSDVSTNGLNPDPNGNNNPTDNNEREATPLNLPATSSSLFIPEGFSPNGDGINDLFIVRGTGSATISLEVYNRWGNMVYKNDDYRNDWDGKANTGISTGGDANGLPDGTYYYVIRLSDGREFVRYMTINR